MERKSNSFSGILLQQEPSEALRRSFSSGRIAQTYLFTGKPSVGRMAVARAFAALLQCQKSIRDEKSKPDSCGICENCIRAANVSHPDIKYITPDGNDIKVDQVREMQNIAVLKPTLGLWQIFIIDPGDKLNQNAANALLKILEEAPAHCVFILLASDTTAVLPTILSRSEVVRFNLPSHHQSREVLQKHFSMTREEAASCYALSEGNFGQALVMAKDFQLSYETMSIKRSHTNYLLQLQLFSQFIEGELSSATTLDTAVKKAWELEYMAYQPLNTARKAVCRSLFMNTGLPAAFPLLFSQEIVNAIDSAVRTIEKSLDPLIAENKKSYPSGVIKEVENQISAAASRWGAGQIEKLLFCLMNWYRDGILAACNSDETLLLNLDRKEDIITVAKVEGLALLRSRIEMLEKSINLLRRYIQPLLILENLITQIGGAEA